MPGLYHFSKEDICERWAADARKHDAIIQDLRAALTAAIPYLSGDVLRVAETALRNAQPPDQEPDRPTLHSGRIPDDSEFHDGWIPDDSEFWPWYEW